MALYQIALLPYATLSFRNKMLPSIMTSRSVPRTIQCMAPTTIVSDQTNTSRRNVNFFQPSIWPHDYIQSLRSDFVEESYAAESDGLQEQVRVMRSKLENPVDQLEFIDILQRLGIEAHFRHEIRNLIENIYNDKDTSNKKSNLHATALEFRILRQHGYGVSSGICSSLNCYAYLTKMLLGGVYGYKEVFKKFLDHEDHFDARLCVDIKGLLSLYEASFLSMEGETILDEARDFSSTCLREFVDKNINNEDDETCLLVKHALELPLHWRVSRLEARWFIDFYEKRENMSPTFLKLAKLDFNMVQVSHLEDLKYTSRWWERIGLLKEMSFTRDRLVENFFWTVGYNYEPQLGHYRRVLTKVNALITAIDDVYDVYGTLEELELFTDVVDRWDVNSMDILPDYMKICFLALYNFVHEEALEFIKENGHNVIPLLRKMWADLCKAYLVEAKWFYSNYKPSLHDYLENAWISSSGPVILVHSYLLLQTTTTKEDLFCFQEYSDLIRFSSIILRLTDDLGSSQREKETGDVAKAIECYMNETGASEADAYRHINCLISETWKKFNKEASNSSYPKSFIEVARNLARVSHCMYEHGDGHSIQAPQIKNRIMSLLFHPVV